MNLNFFLFILFLVSVLVLLRTKINLSVNFDMIKFCMQHEIELKSADKLWLLQVSEIIINIDILNEIKVFQTYGK